MADVIGRGVIEVSADATKLKAGVDDAKRSIKSLGKDIGDSMGTASARASKSIDNYVKKLQTAAATQGKSARETELYSLALRGASKAQLEAADSALKLSEGYERGVEMGNRLRVGFIALAAAAGAALVATAAGANALIGQVGKYQDLAEKIGDTAVNLSSLKTASDVAGLSIDTIAAASVKLTASLSKTDDESKLVGDAITGLGLDFKKFKDLSPVEQLQAVARAMDGFADGSEKTAYAVALFGKSGAELLTFLKEYAVEGTNAAYITEQQGKAADDFSDAQARLQSQVQQFLQVAAVNAIPILNDITDLMKSIAKEEDGTSAATDILKGALNGAVVVFQAITIVASDVIFTFKAVGREIGAIAAQLAALASLDFNGFNAISDAVKDDAQRARAELDKFQARVLAIGKEPFVDDEVKRLQARSQANTIAAAAKPKLNTSRLNQDKTPKGKTDNSAVQEAKAQLAFDLEEIRKAQEALSNTISNGEKILQAERSANLVSEAEYYAKKRAFIQENDRVEQAAVEKQIERLQQEKLTGKEKIDNDRKILDAQAKLAKLRENSTANLKVLAIQEADALDQIRIKYEQAAAAAQSYVDTIAKQNQRDLAGLGKGNLRREQDSRRNQREDQLQGRRDSLDQQRRAGQITSEEYDKYLQIEQQAHDRALASDEDYWTKKLELQKDWTVGATEALTNYYDEAQNKAKNFEEVVTNGLKGLEDQLTNLLTGGKFDAKSFLKSIQEDLTRNFVKENITGPLAGFLKDSIGGEAGGLLSGLLGGGKGKGANGVSSLSTSAATGSAALDKLTLAATEAAAALSSTGATGGGGGGGGLLSSIAGLAAGAFGGFSNGAATTLANASGGGLDDLFKFTNNFAGRAIGGPVTAGSMYRINEKGAGEVFEAGGKQWFMPGQDGKVMPGGGDGSGMAVTINQTFAEGTNRKTTDQAAQQASRAIERARRNS
ncbi:hypothetical protein C7T35_15465 [Variovorax sp. WS11]|uniref:phage tail tape measure protein n=1 Tax=Variovorax sp. WS11 TaxID=1105204 RepID=UPI000D0D9A73|nr:phage tail tape measure C-terminal domain-containing protein [Variovorax sp. WS11]NDZ12039.1 hypothetical protein [Variovorax sp. WS11]PSL83776.1 hypothetical protein C7T35_15465 [Variovorax sp. WS11]